MVIQAGGRKFLDSLRLYVKAGKGGNGYPKYNGHGGKGGDVFVEGFQKMTLQKTKNSKKGKQFKAMNGCDSRHLRIFGEAGEDLVIPVPCGTTVKSETGQNFGDIIIEGDKVLVAKGGLGGNVENQFFGQKGEQRHIELLLKLIADVGFVGFPNAGKSTLLRALSHAKPKIASYPFTTLHPNIGTLMYEDKRQITAADLPGLIEGAWSNVGMGHKFLRHVERTKLLLFVVDIEGFRLGPEYPFRTAIDTIILLNKELELYDADLIEKPTLLVINKTDTAEDQRKFDKICEYVNKIKEISKLLPEEMQPERFVKFSDIVACSAKFSRESTENVKEKIREVIDLNYQTEIDIEKVNEFINDQLYEKKIKLI